MPWHHRVHDSTPGAVGRPSRHPRPRPGQALRRPRRRRRHRLRGRAAARSSACSDPTARARRRRSRSSRACARPTAARRPSSASTSPTGADALKPRIGVSLQTAALYPKLTVAEVIDLFRSFYPRPATDRRADRRCSSSASGATPRRRTCRAASASGWRSPSPWSTTPSSSSSTSRRPGSTRRPAARCGTSSVGLKARRPDRPADDPLHGGGRGPVRPPGDHGPRPASSRWAPSTSWSRSASRSAPSGSIAIDGLGDARAGRAARRWSRSSTTTVEVLLYTRDVAATIGALLAADRGARRRAAEPRRPPGDARRRLPRPDRSSAAGLTDDR